MTELKKTNENDELEAASKAVAKLWVLKTLPEEASYFEQLYDELAARDRGTGPGVKEHPLAFGVSEALVLASPILIRLAKWLFQELMQGAAESIKDEIKERLRRYLQGSTQPGAGPEFAGSLLDDATKEQCRAQIDELLTRMQKEMLQLKFSDTEKEALIASLRIEMVAVCRVLRGT